MKPLPRHLQRAVTAQSATVQELIFEVALHVCGMPPELPMAGDWARPIAGARGGYRHDHLTADDREELRDYLYARDRSLVERHAVGVAVIAGRSSTEIDEFFGWEGVAKSKLQWLRRLVRRRQ